MKAQRIGCCRREARRSKWAAGGVTFAALAALMPKCPLCVAAWFGVLGLSGLAGRIDPRVLWLATALAVAVCSTFLVHRMLTWKETRS